MRPYCIFPRGILWPLELPPLYFISGSAAALLKTPITVPTTVSSTAPQATSLAHCQPSVSLSSSFCGDAGAPSAPAGGSRSDEHTSELQSLLRISYAVFCLSTQKQAEYATTPST